MGAGAHPLDGRKLALQGCKDVRPCHDTNQSGLLIDNWDAVHLDQKPLKESVPCLPTNNPQSIQITPDRMLTLCFNMSTAASATLLVDRAATGGVDITSFTRLPALSRSFLLSTPTRVKSVSDFTTGMPEICKHICAVRTASEEQPR
jgi:hypothetical protein